MKRYFISYVISGECGLVFGNTTVSINPKLFDNIPEGILSTFENLVEPVGDATLINFWEI